MRVHRCLLLMVGLSLGLGCGSKKDESGGTSAPSKQDDSANQGGGMGALLGGSGAMAMNSLFANAKKPGLYDAPRESAGFSDGAAHMAVLELSGSVVELQSLSLFGGTSGIELRTIENRLRELAADANIKALLLRADGLAAGMTKAEELRRALVAFKGDGQRSVYCHIEGASNVSYFLLTTCDSIGIAPTGEIAISGVAAMPLHLKGLLDKLDIRADFLHVGDYKGAAEPLTLDEPSDAMRETLQAILDDSYDAMVQGIAEGRGLEAPQVKALIDTAMFNSKEAVAAKLVDEEATFEAYRSKVAGELAWKNYPLEEQEEPGFGKIMQLLGLQPRVRSSADHVAVVYAVGNVVDGKGDGLIGARNQIASRTLVATLRTLADADSVKAVVLRVDSPGGSALASELIWHAIDDLKKKKPVVVSMGSVAASGGYYISCDANRIFAENNTLTGSIGVVGGKLAIGGALEKLGIRTFPMGRGKRAMMWSTMNPWSSDERAAIQKMMEEVYEVFVGRVAAGRGKTRDEIHAIAQGRVWTGKSALANGLVDEIGGLDAAIAHAEKLVGVDAKSELEIYPPNPNLMDYMSSFTGGNVSLGALGALAEVRSLLGDEAAAVVSATLEQVASFRSEHVQTSLLLPVLWQ